MRLKRLISSIFALSLFALSLGAGGVACAQISLSTAVDLALKNSPKVKMAQADLAKAKAALAQAREAYVPMISTTGGVGRGQGAPLGVPVVFSISAQSLAFNFSQFDYIRSSRAGVESAQHALKEAQIEVVEDTSSTYVTLDNALQRREVMTEERSLTEQLVKVSEERLNAGVDQRIELTKSRRTGAQIRLQALLLEDEIAGQAQHLSTLTALPARSFRTVHDSIPQFQKPTAHENANTAASSEGIAAADAAARAKQYAAFGDRRFLLRPQVAFAANYSRVNTAFSNYTDYYPSFNVNPRNGRVNSENSFGIGIQITIPLLDMVQRARARSTAAEAAHAFAEAEMQRNTFLEGRVKLQHAALELDARRELAALDRDLAEEQFEAVQVQLQASAANLQGPQMTPKDALSAKLQERQKFYEVLASELQLQQTEVNLLRQGGGLGDWIHQSIGAPGAAGPVSPVITPQVNVPAAPGTTPVSPASSPSGSPAPIPNAPSPQ